VIKGNGLHGMRRRLDVDDVVKHSQGDSDFDLDQWSRSAAGATTRPTRPMSEGGSW